MTAQTLQSERPAAPDDLLATLADSSRAWANAIERLRALRRLPGQKPGGYALHETIAAARPALVAAMHRELGGTQLVVVPTPDAAERAFADLLYYLGDRSGRVALLRSREEAVGAIESPSERSARLTLLADLAANAPRIVLAPIAALAQRLMRRARFEELRFSLQPGSEPGWEALQQRLFGLGYTRVDVVSAVGEYAVRGGIIDLFAASADVPARIEFFGDTIESLRTFAIESQRSDAAIERLAVTPWDDRLDENATLFDYLPADAMVVL
ncbi:MAG: hypothetical protein WAK16_05375, partial [Candidatus Cybelea sp.]